MSRILVSFVSINFIIIPICSDWPDIPRQQATPKSPNPHRYECGATASHCQPPALAN